ncbi:PilZ domain-containing protein [Candidatus Latescibacterota bacterium]
MYEEDLKDKRKEKRVDLVYNLAAYDRNSGEVIGYLADITPSGVMLLCEKPLELNKEYYFKIEINSPSSDSKQIQFDAECCWRKTNDSIDFYNCGFKFTRIDTEYIGEIDFIIEQYCIEE